MLWIFLSSLILAVVFLVLIAFKWRIEIWVAAISGVFIGALTGFLVNMIQVAWPELNVVLLIFIEICMILMISSIVILLNFYRDPERVPPEMESVILSPADGKVVYVNDVEKSSSLVSTKGKTKFELKDIMSTNLLTDAVYLIGIDMNILNVHVNRAPIEGTVMLNKRTRGKFVSLRRQDSEIINERISTVIDNGEFKIGVVQISSRLVRKIVSYIKEGDILRIGQRLGSILFGSQVDVVVPELKNLEIMVKPGDKVKAGITVIARYGDK